MNCHEAGLSIFNVSPRAALNNRSLSRDFRTLLAREMEHNIGLGDAAYQPTRAEMIDHRKSLSVHIHKLFQSRPHSLVWGDPREILVYEIRCNHHPWRVPVDRGIL